NGAYWGTPDTLPVLPAGLYRMTISDRTGMTFQRVRNDTDSLIQLPDTESEFILEELRAFTTLKPKFKEYGLLFKRGILLWGPPGSGKTCTLQLAIRMLLKIQDAVIALVDHPHVAMECLQMLRRLEPDRPVVLIMEDIDSLIKKYDEAGYLALLDGEAQIGNVTTIATTNYPELLDRRFADRPSRFDTIKYIGMPTAAARRHFLQCKMPNVAEDVIDGIVGLSEDMSIAHLREFIVLTQCFGLSVKEAGARLKHMRENLPVSDKAPGHLKFGFS
ncbi:MAG: ATP-binding protein, partial [Acidobacteriales bacterium]|nr:ATP-binding protein [Terriglobales bacterium]